MVRDRLPKDYFGLISAFLRRSPLTPDSGLARPPRAQTGLVWKWTTLAFCVLAAEGGRGVEGRGVEGQGCRGLTGAGLLACCRSTAPPNSPLPAHSPAHSPCTLLPHTPPACSSHMLLHIHAAHSPGTLLLHTPHAHSSCTLLLHTSPAGSAGAGLLSFSFIHLTSFPFGPDLGPQPGGPCIDRCLSSPTTVHDSSVRIPGLPAPCPSEPPCPDPPRVRKK